MTNGLCYKGTLSLYSIGPGANENREVGMWVCGECPPVILDTGALQVAQIRHGGRLSLRVEGDVEAAHAQLICMMPQAISPALRIDLQMTTSRNSRDNR